MKVPKIYANEADWIQERVGRIGGTRISSLLTDVKREMTEKELADWKKENPTSKAKTIVDETILSSGAMTTCYEISSEINTGVKPDQFVSFAMNVGKQQEPFAFAEFCRVYGLDTNDPDVMYFGGTQFGMYLDGEFRHSSPDIVMMKYELIGEVKCPNSATHEKYLMLKDEHEFAELEPDYYEQIQWNMHRAEAKGGIFISFDDRYKDEELRLKVIKISPNVPLQEKMYRKSDLAITEVKRIQKESRELNKTKVEL